MTILKWEIATHILLNVTKFPQNKSGQVFKGNGERKAAQDTSISNAPQNSCVNSLTIFFFGKAFFDETRTYMSSSVEDTYNSVRGVCEAEVKIADDWGSGTGCHGRAVEPTLPLPSSSLPADNKNKNKSIRY